MNIHETDALDQELRSLAEDVPPMPEGFHAGWMKQVEEEAMQKKSTRTQWTRILSVAAALIFVVGGTMLSRDNFSAETSASKDAGYYTSASPTSAYGTTVGYSMRGSASYEEASYDSAAESTVMMSKVANNDAAAVAETSPEKKIIRTASLNIATQAFDESLAALKQLCEEKGGWIANVYENADSARRTASLTMRIPSTELDAFLDGVGDTGRITWRSESADDVTESYYDTMARLETQQALKDRLLALVTEAADLRDLLELESEIADTQYQIDRLQAQLNSTDRQVDYATVDVSLREEIPSDSLITKERTFGERLMDAIETGWEAFTEFLGDMVVFLAASFPFVLVIAVVVIVVKVIRKRRRK
ncbi:MAG: DUF4349 domain-containing protein [Clostridiales bacterium]|nr:DUF4349 domain-containing protein [Clostridiales bacterium]